MSADSGSEMLDYTDSEEERKREEEREQNRVDKCIFQSSHKHISDGLSSH